MKMRPFKYCTSIFFYCPNLSLLLVSYSSPGIPPFVLSFADDWLSLVIVNRALFSQVDVCLVETLGAGGWSCSLEFVITAGAVNLF